MSPPLLTKARSRCVSANIAESTWSATAPATAAIGVMKRSAKGMQAACIARATGPSGGRVGNGAQRRQLDAKRGKDGWERALGLRIGARDLFGFAPGPAQTVDWSVLQMQPSVRKVCGNSRRHAASIS